MSEHCKYTPTILVPGIGQSKVDLYSRDGRRISSAWPLDIDEKSLLKKITPAAVKMLVTRKDSEFLAVLKKEVSEAIKALAVNNEGISKANLKVVDYDGHSLAECSEDERRYIYKMVPVEELPDIIGEDHLFFFAYNSFGQPYETAAKLNAYIQQVKKKTGHSKVNLVPISLGGSIATAYFDAYGDRNDVKRVCYFVPAANGSTLIADVFDRNLDFSNPRALFALLLGNGTAKTICGFADRLPKGTMENICRTLIDAVCEVFLMNCAAMWAVVPKEEFLRLKAKYLEGGSHSVLRAKAERFYRAQSNLEELLTKQEKRGVKFFSICGYDNELLPFAGTKKLNSDTIVDFKSASLGGTAAKAGETLGADYKKAYCRCQNKEHNHISPEGTVDLGTAIFPDSTFCFRYQIHDDTAYNDVALSLCKEILTNDKFTDVYSDKRFPQFNGTRNIFRIRYKLLPRAYELMKKDIHESLLSELKAAVDEAEAVFTDSIIENGDKAKRATERLDAAVEAATPDLRK